MLHESLLRGALEWLNKAEGYSQAFALGADKFQDLLSEHIHEGGLPEDIEAGFFILMMKSAIAARIYLQFWPPRRIRVMDLLDCAARQELQDATVRYQNRYLRPIGSAILIPIKKI